MMYGILAIGMVWRHMFVFFFFLLQQQFQLIVLLMKSVNIEYYNKYSIQTAYKSDFLQKLFVFCLCERLRQLVLLGKFLSQSYFVYFFFQFVFGREVVRNAIYSKDRWEYIPTVCSVHCRLKLDMPWFR